MSAERQITFSNTYKVFGSETDRYFCQLPEHDLSALYTLLDRNSTVLQIRNAVDIGANIGLSSLCIFDRHPDTNIFAFEPSPENIRFLEENIRANGRNRGFHLIAAAVGERREKLGFEFNRDYWANSKIVRGPARSYEVNVVPLDYQLSDRTEKIDLIKIDVEGHEIPVLKGAKKIIREDNPVVFFECNPYAIKTANADVHEFLAEAVDLLGPIGLVDAASGQIFALPSSPLDAEAVLMGMLDNELSVFDLVTLRSRFKMVTADSSLGVTTKAMRDPDQLRAELVNKEKELAQARDHLKATRIELEQANAAASLHMRRAEEANARLLTEKINSEKLLDTLLKTQREMFEKLTSEESEVQRLRNLVAKRERRMGEMHQLRVSDAKLARVNAAAAAAREKELAADRDRAEAERDAARSKLHEDLNNMSASWSWKVTLPLRWLGADRDQSTLISAVAAERRIKETYIAKGSLAGPVRIESLLALDGPAFIDAAYLATLHRKADPEGASHLLSILNMGAPRIEILARMLLSPEGARAKARLEGFGWRYRIYKISTRPVIGGIVRLMLQSSSSMCGATLDVQSLLRLHGEAFVREAYRAILHRPADNEGLKTYLTAMSAGTSKIRVISSLRKSPEGRKSAARLRGLLAARIQNVVYRIPLIGRISMAWNLSGKDLIWCQKHQRWCDKKAAD